MQPCMHDADGFGRADYGCGRAGLACRACTFPCNFDHAWDQMLIQGRAYGSGGGGGGSSVQRPQPGGSMRADPYILDVCVCDYVFHGFATPFICLFPGFLARLADGRVLLHGIPDPGSHAPIYDRCARFICIQGNAIIYNI